MCNLLKEIDNARTDSLPSLDHDLAMNDGITSAADVITKKLVTFSDIKGLQENNSKLLSIVRELSTKHEAAETVTTIHINEMKEKINTMKEEHTSLLENQDRQSKMLKQAINQRSNYEKKCKKSQKSHEEDIQMEQSSNVSVENETTEPKKGKIVTDLENKINALNKELTMLKEDYESYRKEKQANEKMLIDQLEKLRDDNHELTQNSYKLTTMAEYKDENFKVLKTNCDSYKNQIAVLEEKNNTYSAIIVKHEQSIIHLKDEVLNAQTKLARAETNVQNLQQELHILKATEARLLKEREITARSNQSQNLLLNNLEMIKASLERSEAEGKMRLEVRLDDAVRECSALRRRLQEEQDKFRELTNHLERQTGTAQTRMEEEKQHADQLRSVVAGLRDELTNKNSQLEELTKKLKNSLLLSRATSDDSKAKEMEHQIKNYEEEVSMLKQQLALSKESVIQYCNIAEVAERELREEIEKNSKYQQETQSKIMEYEKLTAELKEKCMELDTELSIQSNGQHEINMELRNELSKTKQKLEVATEELDVARREYGTARNEIKTLSEAVTAAEDKYTREVMLHSSDLQSLTNLKEEFTKVNSELGNMVNEKEMAIEAFNVGKTNWEEREKMLQEEINNNAEKLKEIDNQNMVLHDQIQALSTQLQVAHAQHADMNSSSSADVSMNRSMTEDEMKSSEQLLQIIKFLRREKDLAITRFEVLQAENTRLKSQFEVLEKHLQDAKESLAAERENNEVSVVTAAKHAEVLRKVETLNAITDSNRILRDERDSLKMQVTELTARANSLEEQLVPLQEKNRELTVKSDTASTEINAFKAEATRWRQRANVLIEKANKVSPEDWQKLQREKEALVKYLSAEKDAHRKLMDEANTIRQERTRLDEACNNLTNQNKTRAIEIKKLNDDLSTIKSQCSRLSQELIEQREIAHQRTDENTKITEDLAAKDVQLTEMRAKETQVRKIAKKYKTQYEELMKTVEEEKSQNEQKEKAPLEVPPEMQEQYRNEGRSEVEQKLADLEKALNERTMELNERTSAFQTEVENLKKDNALMKSEENERDERTKFVLKAAKSKITDLTDERNKLRKELNELRIRFDTMEQNKDAEKKEKTDAANERQIEKERYQREIESLTQRVNQLQRQLGLPPASKPSTSSASDKSGSEPPTANIKPMSGHSNQTQQSATVMPWRGGETPFASIRPMSQLRTVAVLPTSQNAGNSSQSTAVLVPPQQQLVHTTGNSSIEVMSSSPTSSHTDYMPATSSASPAVAPIRQVVVPPTQQATIGKIHLFIHQI